MPEESPFANLNQIGIVVNDIDKAVRYYESLGFGPFQATTIPGETVNETVYGRPSARKLINMITHIGVIEIEISQPVEDAPIQEDFLREKGEGINHIGFQVKDVAKEQAKLEKKGFKVIQSRKFSSGAEFVYFDTNKVGGVIMELGQLPTK
ncbi:VOC family protein [Chloroflexota bacterium]